MTIILTGTHLTPAIATIQALKKKAPGARLVYVGRKHTGAAESVEREEVELAGAEFRQITFGKLHRHFTWRQILELVKFPVGFWQAGKLAVEFKPDAVVSFGGYVALPVAIWGKLLGARIVLHEQTTEWGLVNRLLRPVADVAAVSWENMVGPGAVWTGNPIREEVLDALDDPRRHFLDTLGSESSLISSSPLGQSKSKVLSGSSSVVSKMPPSAHPLSFFGGFPVVYITGGNQGARAIDRVVEKILPDLVEKFEVFHQTKSKIGFKHPRYHPAEWFSTPVHAEILSRAAVSVSRAGANTVTELMYLKVPAILVPLPGSAGGEQDKNAEILVRAGLGRVIKQEELTSARLLGEIREKEREKKEKKEKRGEGNTAAERLAEVILREKEKEG